MKNIIRTSIIAALLVGLTAAPAHADDEALAAIGGFVVGMITGAAIEHHDGHHADYGVEVHYDTHSRYGHRDHGYRCGKHNRHGCHSCKSHRKGHWETRKVRVWVPGHWAVVVNDCGDRVRVWKSGHYTYERQRYWVSHRRDHRRYSRCG